MTTPAPTLATLNTRLASVEAQLTTKTAELNTFYLLWAAGLVFLMQVRHPLVALDRASRLPAIA